METEFKVGDSCVCLHRGATPYDAKVIAIKGNPGGRFYVVHFAGFNSRHDERIPVSESSGRMFKCTIQEYNDNHRGETSEPKAKKKRTVDVVANSQPVGNESTDTPTASVAPVADAVHDEVPTSSATRAPKRKPAAAATAAAPAPVVEQAAFAIGENCLCLQGGIPYPAKVVDIKEYQGVNKYIVHFLGWSARYDQKITVGDEPGKIFKETLEEYKKKYGGETSGPAVPAVQAPKKKTNKKDVQASVVHVEQPVREFTISTITPADADHLIGMIHELAEFEKMKDSVVNTAEKLRNDIKNNNVHGFIAFDGEEPAGMNLFYYAYSTWVGKYIHMEDLYIRPQFRRRGLARNLWKKLAQLAKEKEIVRLEWAVLDWNKDAIALYDTVDYVNLTKKEGWFTFRMDGAAINKFADE